MEQFWIEEVRYLHALWRQGPPRKPNQSPRRNESLRPQSSTAFKKEGSATRPAESRDNKKEKKTQQQVLQEKPLKKAKSPVSSSYEWPCKSPRAAEAEDTGGDGWEWPKPKVNPSVTRLTEEEFARLSAVRIQKEAAQCFREFFEEEEDSEDEAEEDSFEFFMELFEKDEDLKAYYQKNWEHGEFICLVCAGSGKWGKKFVNCVALVRHMCDILKTKRKVAHRAFGRAACQVLGWDINKLPIINPPADKESDVNEEAAAVEK